MLHIKRITLLVAISGGLFASAAYADDGYVGYAIDHGAKPLVTSTGVCVRGGRPVTDGPVPAHCAPAPVPVA
ncbi:OmpA family protein, partial [Acidithiobacillus sp. MC6.1]|nr:OmpA family protein [Acidithiobacillus sp. MC6.1]